MYCVREFRNDKGAREMLGDESRLQWFEHAAPAPPHTLKSHSPCNGFQGARPVGEIATSLLQMAGPHPL